MKKVLFIVPSLCHGGINEMLALSLNNIDRKKYKVSLFLCQPIFTLQHKVPEDIEIIVDKKNIHYHRKPRSLFLKVRICVVKALKAKNKVSELKKQYEQYIHTLKIQHPAKDYFSKEHFDIAISYAWGRCTEMVSCINANRHYAFMHGSIDLHHELMEKLLPDFDGIIAVGKGVRDMLRNAYPQLKDKVLLLENYIDAESIVEKSKEIVTDIPGFADNKTVLCSCGRLSKEKGFDLAVKAAKLLRDKGVNFIWLFVGGDDGELLYLQKLVEKYVLQDNILFIGYKDNPFPYLKMCDIYVQPSYEEAQPLILLENMVLEKPIVSTRTVGGMCILENGKKGVLTDFSAEDIANGIIRLIKDPKLRESLSHVYSLEDNEKEKEVFKNTLDEILSK